MENVSLILDMECFTSESKKLIPREVCLVRVDDGKYFHFMVDLREHFPALKEQKSNWYVSKLLTGLTIFPYLPKERDLLIDYKDFDNTLMGIIKANTTTKRPLVAYKGGIVERDLLARLGVPSIDLELCGCPKVKNSLNDHCGIHRDLYDQTREVHCAFIDVFLYREWLLDMLSDYSSDDEASEKQSHTSACSLSSLSSSCSSSMEEVWLLDEDDNKEQVLKERSNSEMLIQSFDDCFWIEDQESEEEEWLLED